jgi:hypothetical protein
MMAPTKTTPASASAPAGLDLDTRHRPRRRAGAARTRLRSAAVVLTFSVLLLGGTAHAAPPPVAEISAAYEAASDSAGAPPAPPVTAVTRPSADASGGVTVGDGANAIRVTPESAAASGAGISVGDGTTVYRGADPDVSTVVEPTSDGARIATVSTDGSAAAQTFRYRVGLPGRGRLRARADGGVDMVLGRRVIGRFAAPWARDANGTSLTTSYRVDGTTLVQVVATAGAAFPVVADPTIERLTVLGIPRGVKIWFARTETEALFRNKEFAATVTVPLVALCSGLSGLTLTGLCLTAVSYVTVDYIKNLEDAHGRHHCLWLEVGLPKVADWGEGDGDFCVHP